MSVESSIPSVEPESPLGTIAIGEERPVDLFYDKTKMLWFALLLGAVAIGTVWSVFHGENHDLLKQAFLLSFAVLLGFLTLILLTKYFSSAPPLTLSPQGIWIRSYSANMIPWKAVVNMERERTRYTNSITIHIDLATAKNLKRRGMFRWLQSSRSKTKAVIPLGLLGRDSDRIYDICENYLVRARQSSPYTPSENEFEQNQVATAAAGHPIFSYLLILLLITVYIADVTLGVDPIKAGSPSVRTLFVLGGTFRPVVVEGGEWWRVFTAPLMHGSPLHLAFNCYALWQAGRLLERRIGWPWFAAIFFLSALGGSLASTFLNGPNIVGVGASGGIVGLFAAVIAASFHYPSGPLANALRIGAMQILIPSLLPFLSRPAEGAAIDYSAHLGGAIVGGLLALLLLAIWPRQRVHPRFAALAIVFCGLFAVIAVFSLLPIAVHRNMLLHDPMTQFFSGKYQDAANSFASEAIGSENAPYYYLWRYIAQRRGNDPAASVDLVTDEAKIDKNKWPFPVYSLFLNQIDPSALSQDAINSDQQCEATFYTGEWDMMQGNRIEATRHFQSALGMCPTTFLEYEGARGELSLLGTR
ncbi:MAG: rhomboid family intramembrane serine protease [Rhizobiaceae bacterium]|nr:rhomboid family intramembrane serine protease [Rhizobiaceae bacterium]